MNAPPSSSASQYEPLPGRQLRWFIMFFHAVFVGGLALSLIMRWRRANWAFDATDNLLVGLVVAQVALYVGLFAIPIHIGRWPKPRWLAFYFVASIAVFFAECRIEHTFYWAVGAYMGQLLALPWRVSLPATGLLFAGYFLIVFGWNRLASFTVWEWLIGLGSIAAWTGVVMFLHRALATSSERGKLIAELETAQRELELARHRDAELAVLKERERMARDLHDSLGHSLVTVTVQLEAAQRLLPTDPARAAALVTDMQKLTRAAMEDLRRSLANLRAHGLGDRPLAGTLRLLGEEIAKRSGLNIECHLGDHTDRLPPAVAEVLWRVAQEGLTNVEKHARARHARVSLSLEPTEVRLQVSDNGVGLRPDAEETPGHYGLRGMRERVEGLGGTFTVAPAGSQGTLIEVRIPVIGS